MLFQEVRVPITLYYVMKIDLYGKDKQGHMYVVRWMRQCVPF